MYVTPQIRRLIPHLRAHAHLTEALRDAAHGTAQTTCRQTASVKIQIVFMVKNRIQFQSVLTRKGAPKLASKVDSGDRGGNGRHER